MPTISDAEIAAAAKAAGFTGDDLVTMVAISLGESRGNTTAHNAVPPDDSYGLAQINMIDVPAGTRAKRRKLFGITRDEQLYDPVTNFKAAKILKDGRGNFNDWSVYIHGTYRLYLPRARKAAGSPAAQVPGSGSDTVPAGITAPSSVTGFIGLISDPVTWMRVGMFFGGGVLILIALNMMSGASVTAAKIATTVLPTGKVAKAATAAVKGA